MFDALIPSDEPPTPLDLAPFTPAMPVAVAAELARAARGEGMVAAWWQGRTRAGVPVRVVECDTLANRGGISHELFGWLAGITAFEDPSGHVLALLRRPSHRDPAIEPALTAVAHGIAGGRAANARTWSLVEVLAARLARPPSMLARALPFGVVSRLAVVRGAALRMAQRLGDTGRAALEAARAHAPASDAKLIDKALVALAGGTIAAAPADDELALLGRLLEAWRRTHDPQLEGPIQRLGRAIARARGPLVAASRAELEGAWLALAATVDAADVDRLFDTPWPTSWKAAALRVRALAAFAPDPRIACRAPAIVRRYDSSHVLPLYRAVAELVLPSATRAMLPELDTLAAEVGRILAKTYAWHRGADPLQQVYDAIDALVVAPADPELLALCAEHAASADIDALYAEHAANPADLGARTVLADALQVAGDPRGELIALQLALADGAGDAKAARRADALIAEHGDTWTGPLPGVRRATRRFARGFLVAAETTASPALLARSLARPEWRTVEELALTTAEPGDVGPLLHRLPLLARLACRAGVLRTLGESGATFPGIRVLFSDSELVPARAQFPDLEVLGLATDRTDALADLEASVAALGVRTLVHVGVVHLGALARALRGVASGPAAQCFVVGEARATFAIPDDGVLRIRRAEPTTVELAHVGVRIVPGLAQIVENLASLGVRRLAVQLPSGLHADFFTSRRLGLEVVPGGPIDLTG